MGNNKKYNTSSISEYVKKYSGLAIPVITIGIFSIAFFYKYGFLSYYNIPSMYMNINITYLASKLPWILAALALLYLGIIILDSKAKHRFTPFNSYEEQRKEDEEKSKSEWYLEYKLENKKELYFPIIMVISYSFLFGIYLFLEISIFNLWLLKILMLGIIIAMSLYIALGLRLYLICLIIVFVGMSGIVFNVGYVEAKTKSMYEVIDENKVILDYFEDTYLVGTLNGNQINPHYTIYSIKENPLTFTTKKIGTLSVKK
jgi:hypothetical protein